jgi:citronellyl-CoA dehydrogenase
MQLTPEHEALRDTLNRFIDTEINPHVDEWERDEIFPAHQVFGRLGELGLLGLTKPVENGGSGLDYSYGAVLAEGLARMNCGGIPMAIGVQTDMATPALAHRGSKELRDEFLAPAITGEYVASLGVSEVGSGSDVASIKTTARKDGGDYLINGGKMWTTNGTQADFCCVLANTSESSDTAQLHFDDVRVPQRYRIGEEGMGFIYQMEQFQLERLWGALNTAGMAQRAIDTTIGYTRDRQAFGRSILDNQWVHYRLAELQTEVACLRAICWQGVAEVTARQDATRTATMAKLKAGRVIREVADSCLQFWGGMGFMDESPISRIFRDGRLTSIGGGADEVMLQILSKFMGIFPQPA